MVNNTPPPPVVISSHQQETKNWLTRILRDRWIKLISLLLTVGFAAYYLVSHFSDLWQVVRERPLSPGWLLISILCIMTAVIVGVLTWKSALQGFNFSFNWRQVLRMHILPTFAKYIPGVVWQFSGKTYLANEAGVPVPLALAAIGIEVGFSLLSGITLFLLLLFKGQLIIPGVAELPTSVLFIIGIVLMALLWFLPLALHLFYSSSRHKTSVKTFPGYWYMSLIYVFLGWGLIALAFFTSAISFGFTSLSYLDSLIAICGAYVSGILVIFVPNGLVVREAVLLTLLPSGVDHASGLLLSLIARVEVIVCELMVGGIFLAGSLRMNRQRKVIGDK